MTEFFKLDITQSLLKLEYICLQKDIPFYIVKDLKLSPNNFSQVIIFKEDKEFESAVIDSDGEIWIAGVSAKFWNDERTTSVCEMLKETLDMIPFTEIEPEKDLDSILDKINKWGVNSLLEEEFKFLYNY
jgi:hypothetical protein